MECRDAQHLLLDECLGEIASEERAALEAHLAECLACREESAEIARSASLLRSALATDRPAPVGLPAPRRAWRWMGAVAAVAAVATVAAVAPLAWPRRAPPAAPAWLEIAATGEGVRIVPRGTPPPPPDTSALPVRGRLTIEKTGGRNLDLARNGTLRISGRVEIEEAVTVHSGFDVRMEGGMLVAQAVRSDGTFSVRSGTLALSRLQIDGSLVVGTGDPLRRPAVWTGAAGDSLWHTGANWSTGRVPSTEDDVWIAQGRMPILTQPAVCRSLRVGESLSEVTP